MKTKTFRIATADGNETLHRSLSFSAALNALGISSTNDDTEVAKIAKLAKHNAVNVNGKLVVRLK